MITRTEAEYQSDAGSTKDTPYPALPGEIWGVFCEYFEKMDRVITAPHCICFNGRSKSTGMNLGVYCEFLEIYKWCLDFFFL